MGKGILVLVVVLAIGIACATRQYVWFKGDYNEAQFQTDVYRCQQDATVYSAMATGQAGNIARQNPTAMILLGERQVNFNGRFNQCMELSGYQLQEKK